MARRRTPPVGRQQRLLEIWRIGNYGIEPFLRKELLQRQPHHLDTAAPRRGGDITAGLCHTCRIHIYGRNARMRGTLRRHQGNKTCPCPYVEDTAFDRHPAPCTDEYAVGAHLHGAPAVVDVEPFECEPAAPHIT